MVLVCRSPRAGSHGVSKIAARAIKAASPALSLGFGTGWLKFGRLGFPQEQGKMLGINRLNINS